jgi:ATP phosphoribosyltransferase regulatory subunit HisZ
VIELGHVNVLRAFRSLATLDGARREQLRRWAQLPLDRAIAALEEMADLAEVLRAPGDRAE